MLAVDSSFGSRRHYKGPFAVLHLVEDWVVRFTP